MSITLRRPSKDAPARILVPVDCESSSINAVRYAFKVAGKVPATIHFLHAFYSPAYDLAELIGVSNIKHHLREEVLENIRLEEEKKFIDYINEMVQPFLEDNPSHSIIEHTLLLGAPDEVILKFSKAYNPDVIIIGSKNSKDNGFNILGDMAEIIIKKAHVPVLAIPKEYNFKGIENIQEVVYVTQLDESDFLSIKKLMVLLNAFEVKIHCIHISSSTPSKSDQLKMDGLNDYFKNVYDKRKVKCSFITGKNNIQELDEYVLQNNIKLIATTSRRKNLIFKLF
ncbi:MAG: universal stress protein, partial [bacterium]